MSKKKVLTENSDLGDFIQYVKDNPVVYDEKFWEKIAKSIEKENKDYEKMCERLRIDPFSGKSTMTWEERNRMFDL